jgi:hypothetical protein
MSALLVILGGAFIGLVVLVVGVVLFFLNRERR